MCKDKQLCISTSLSGASDLSSSQWKVSGKCELMGTSQGLTCMDSAPLCFCSVFLPTAWNMDMMAETQQPSRSWGNREDGSHALSKWSIKQEPGSPVAMEPRYQPSTAYLHTSFLLLEPKLFCVFQYLKLNLTDTLAVFSTPSWRWLVHSRYLVSVWQVQCPMALRWDV